MLRCAQVGGLLLAGLLVPGLHAGTSNSLLEVSPDGKFLLAANADNASVTVIETVARKALREIKAGEFLRGIALDAEEKRLYVTEFYTGILHAVDLASGQVVDSWKGHSTDNIARHVVVSPRRPKAYLAHIRSMVTVNHGAGSIFP